MLILCLPICDPLLQNCDEGEGCYPTHDTFICAPDAGGDMGALGESCEYINVCDSGLTCAAAPNVPGCVGMGCCTEFCDVTMPSGGQCSGLEQECLPWFDAAEPTPGLENVGFCGIKQ